VAYDFAINDLDAACGAEVLNFNSQSVLDETDRRRLRRAFDERGVLVFRDIDLDWETQQFLSGMLVGRADFPHEAAVDETVKRVAYVSNKVPGALIPYGRILWHLDTMWSDRPEDAISLYGEDVESGAASTFFVNTAHAWDTTPVALKARVGDLRALHGEGQQKKALNDPELFLYHHENPRSVSSPIALRHHRTGRTLLYVSEQQTREIIGLEPAESEALLEELLAHLYKPAHVYEYQWRRHDFVIWDNLAIQHTRAYVPLDGPTRTLRKVASPPPWIRPDLPPLPDILAIKK
jgi:taurine dioxygenase